MIQRLGTEILAGMKHNAWKISVIDRIREMLCFQADTGVLCVRNALFSRKLHWLVCDIKLQTRLVRKAGHADSRLFGLENGSLPETGSVDDKVVIVSAELFKLLIIGVVHFSDCVHGAEVKWSAIYRDKLSGWSLGVIEFRDLICINK